MSRSKYEHCWSLVWFHVPRDTAESRRLAARFRKVLTRSLGPCACRSSMAKDGRGYSLLLGSPEHWEAKLVPLLPPDAEIRLIGLTDAQYAKTKVAYGDRRKR